MSSDATPGYPAPDTACSVVAATASTPKRAASGARASASMTVEQLGLVTMKPAPARAFPRPSSSARCSAFTSGMSSGTDSSDRKSTRLNSSHSQISYAVFCLKKKKKNVHHLTHITPKTYPYNCTRYQYTLSTSEKT